MRLITFLTTFFTLFNLYLFDDVLDFSEKTSDSFKSELAQYEIALVEFFAPWCGHCKRLAPEYAKASTILKSEPSVPLIKVDCTNENGGKDLCSEYGVSGYPTLKIFKNGELSSDYQGPREADGIVKYMRSQVGPASKQCKTFAELDTILLKSPEVYVIGIFDDENDKLFKNFQKASDRLRETTNFAHVFKSSVSDDLSKLTVVKADLSVPSIVLVRSLVMKNKFEQSHVIYEDESESLDNFISQNYHGLVGHRTQNNMQDFKPPFVVAYYDVDYEKNPKGTNYWRNRVLKVAEKTSKVKFAVSNSQQFAGELEEYGLEPSRDGRDAAPLVVARNEKGDKFVMKEKFSVDSLEQFVNDFLEGKLEVYVKSEEIPADNSGPVKVAVGKNFDELVLNTKKDVLVEFYAPWCGHCKKLAPAYEELGKLLQDEPNVEIVKMDATANDVKAPFVVHGFPTIYWYPGDTKHAKKYEGGREAKDFLKFIAKHASEELKGYKRDGTAKKKEEL